MMAELGIEDVPDLAYDYLVVGAGFAGITIAERLAAGLGKRVLLIDKRDHVGGNCYDRIDDAGVLIHQYGPHFFRTDDEEVFAYLSRFTEWRPHSFKVRAWTKGRLFTLPINIDTLEEVFGRALDERSAAALIESVKDTTIGTPKNAEEQVLKHVGRELYEIFFKGYTEKQWGVPATQLDASITARVPIRLNRDDGYVVGNHQVTPTDGFTAMFMKMLAHPNITVRTGTPYDPSMRSLAHRIVWTGCIDEFYGHKYGRLPFRSLEFLFVTILGKELVNPCGQINYPDASVPYTRIVEIKHLTGQRCPNTTLSIEFPRASGEPFYPILGPESAALYAKYREEAERERDVFFIGRLAQYRYVNMDQVVRLAFDLYERIKGEGSDERDA